MLCSRSLLLLFRPLIQTTEDKALIARFEHVPIPAGAAVIWDQRIPHANSRRNTTDRARMVIYGASKPDRKRGLSPPSSASLPHSLSIRSSPNLFQIIDCRRAVRMVL